MFDLGVFGVVVDLDADHDRSDAEPAGDEIAVQHRLNLVLPRTSLLMASGLRQGRREWSRANRTASTGHTQLAGVSPCRTLGECHA